MAEINAKRCILCGVVCLMIFQITSTHFTMDSTNMYADDYQGRPYYERTTPRHELETEYRTIDGSKNNKQYPHLGKAFTPLKRYLRNAYEDGMSIPPTTNRPSPRELSRVLFKGNTNVSLEAELNAWFVIFGQFLVHDLSLSQSNLVQTSCCSPPSNSSECMPIIPKDDDEIINITTCLNFVRSQGVQVPRQQINAITHYLDCSHIYGSSQKELDLLLDSKTGKLRETRVGNNPLLPTKHMIKPQDACPFFIAGDMRVNENTVLAVYHIIWIREHNLIVDKLKQTGRNWNASKLFQEAREIVIAEWQYIIYNEFLPLLIGKNLMHAFNLYSTDTYEYNPSINPSVSNAFTTSTFRYGHVMVDDFVFLHQRNTDWNKRNTTNHCRHQLNTYSCNTTSTIALETVMKSQDMLYECENSVDATVWGMTERRAQKVNDMRAAKTLTLKSPNIIDLLSFNIQRGRDHGIPSYNQWRKLLGLKPLKFSDPPITHDKKNINSMKRIYGLEKYIDLFVGAVLEKKLRGAALGPTNAHIVASQFHDSKFADRFWYQNDRFCQEQIAVIERQTMTKVLLRNTGIPRLQDNCFKVTSNRNPMINREISDFDITPWRL